MSICRLLAHLPADLVAPSFIHWFDCWHDCLYLHLTLVATISKFNGFWSYIISVSHACVWGNTFTCHRQVNEAT